MKLVVIALSTLQEVTPLGDRPPHGSSLRPSLHLPLHAFSLLSSPPASPLLSPPAFYPSLALLSPFTAFSTLSASQPTLEGSLEELRVLTQFIDQEFL